MKELIKLTGCLAITDKGSYITSTYNLVTPEAFQKWLDNTPKSIKYIFFKNKLAAIKGCSATKNRNYPKLTEEQKLEIETVKYKIATLTLEVEE